MLIHTPEAYNAVVRLLATIPHICSLRNLNAQNKPRKQGNKKGIFKRKAKKSTILNFFPLKMDRIPQIFRFRDQWRDKTETE